MKIEKKEEITPFITDDMKFSVLPLIFYYQPCEFKQAGIVEYENRFEMSSHIFHLFS